MLKIKQRLLKLGPGFFRVVWLVLIATCFALAVTGLSDRAALWIGKFTVASGADAPGKSLERLETFVPIPRVYIPAILNKYYSSPPSLVGIYPITYWHTNNPLTAIELEFYPLEEWSGMQISLAGVFHRFDNSIPPQNQPVYSLLTVLWDAGYTPYVNIYSPVSAASIANGDIDATIRGWADQYRDFASGGRWAYLAPLQEMNWTGLPYSCTPTNYKLAMDHIRTIFTQEGVPAGAVRWVFAPNGYTGCSGHSMATYYPGDSKIDVIAISAYNYGYYPGNPYPGWSTPVETFGDALDEAYALAPSKPIFIAQTGTTAYASPGTPSTAAKNEWLRQTYSELSVYPNLRAIIYYNSNNLYDWAFYKPGVFAFDGYREGIAAGVYTYLSPTVLKTFDLLNGR